MTKIHPTLNNVFNDLFTQPIIHTNTYPPKPVQKQLLILDSNQQQQTVTFKSNKAIQIKFLSNQIWDINTVYYLPNLPKYLWKQYTLDNS